MCFGTMEININSLILQLLEEKERAKLEQKRKAEAARVS